MHHSNKYMTSMNCHPKTHLRKGKVMNKYCRLKGKNLLSPISVMIPPLHVSSCFLLAVQWHNG